MAGGRPSKYKEEYNEIAYKLCLLGMTNDELAKYFEVSPATIDNWIAEKPGFLGSLKAGREEADSNVSDRLYKRAIGYSCPEEKVFCNNGEIISTTIIKHFPPDPTSAIFWLKNRQRGRWRDKIPDNIEENTDAEPVVIEFVVQDASKKN